MFAEILPEGFEIPAWVAGTEEIMGSDLVVEIHANLQEGAVSTECLVRMMEDFGAVLATLREENPELHQMMVEQAARSVPQGVADGRALPEEVEPTLEYLRTGVMTDEYRQILRAQVERNQHLMLLELSK